MNKTTAIEMMGTKITNIQWSWHSVHPVSGAVVVQCWQHPNWFRSINGKKYTVATYGIKSQPTKKGHMPRYEAVMSGADLYVIFQYPNKVSKAIMDKTVEGKLPQGVTIHCDKVGQYVYALDRSEAVTDDDGHVWMPYIPGHMSLTEFNRQQSQIARK
jgi:hypothetical protein